MTIAANTVVNTAILNGLSVRFRRPHATVHAVSDVSLRCVPANVWRWSVKVAAASR